jgi:predicted nucleotidyltransferase
MTPNERDLAWIVGRVRSGFDATAIYLFGSHAKGTPRPGSDMDLLIVGPSRLPRVRRGREVAAALAAFPKRFDLLFYTEEELFEERIDPRSFISTVMANAQILYERDPPKHLGEGERAVVDREAPR